MALVRPSLLPSQRLTSGRRVVVGRRPRSRRALWLATSTLVLPLLLLAVGMVHHIYFDRSGVPDLERFIRFELSTTGRPSASRESSRSRNRPKPYTLSLAWCACR